MRFHGQCCHDHDCAETDCGAAYSLYQHIDIDGVTCLNESALGSCKHIFKAWSQRADFTGESLRSHENDPELLLRIPFAGSVNLKAIALIGGMDGRHPSKMRAFINGEVDFQSVQERRPIQEWDLQEDFRGVLEYPTAASKFKGVHLLSLHFPEILGNADCLEIYFVGLKGEFIAQRREPVVAVYEAKPMPEDHQVPGEHQNIWRMGM